MSQPNPSTAMARAIVDELFRNGVDFVVISPGSRSAALAIAAWEHDHISTRVVLDERSAGFHALGRAKASGKPAAVISTSGTAPANYWPAVVEADMSLTPLVVMSADRPAELRGVGANQTIDQVRLYGDRVRFFADIEAPGAETDRNDLWRSTVSSALAGSLGESGSPGPVHLNVAFREPTVPVSDDGRTTSPEYPFSIAGRRGGGPWQEHRPRRPPLPSLQVASPSRGLVIAGEGDYDRPGLLEAANALEWPVLATALSGLRGENVVRGYHHILARQIPATLRPDLVLAIGAIGPSQRLEELVASAGTRIRADTWGRHIDPGRNATHVLHADPLRTLQLFENGKTESSWKEAWLHADQRVGCAIEEHIAGVPTPTGASVARALNVVQWETLVAASSLPIREVDAHLARPGRVIGNRGASGIDGFVSTGLGAASAGRRTVSLAGDLSLLHDANGFLSDVIDDLVLVVIDNGGGGLFDSLPPSAHAPHFERLFVAPPDRDIEQLARFHRIDCVTANSTEELTAAIEELLDRGGVSVLRIPVDRGTDLQMRQSLDEIGRSVMSLLET